MQIKGPVGFSGQIFVYEIPCNQMVLECLKCLKGPFRVKLGEER